MDILIIKEEWGRLILDGKKTWELRGSNTNKRGKIALAFSKTSKIFGYVELVDSISMTKELFDKNKAKHQSDGTYKSLCDRYKNPHAWIVKNPVWLKNPKPYVHPYGAVIWVKQD